MALADLMLTRTGRYRTVTVTGTCGGRLASLGWAGPDPAPIDTLLPGYNGYWDVYTPMSRFWFQLGGGPSGTPWNLTLHADINQGLGTGDLANATNGVTLGYNYDISAAATWTCTYTVEELCHYSVDQLLAGGAFVDKWDGYSAPPINRLLMYEALKPGTTVTATVTAFGVTATATYVVPSWTTVLPPGVHYNCQFRTYVSGNGGDANTFFVTGTWQGLAITAPYSASDSKTSGSATGGASCTVNSGELASAECNLSWGVPRKWTTAGTVRRMSDAFTGSLGFRLSKASTDTGDPSFDLDSSGADIAVTQEEKDLSVYLRLYSGVTTGYRVGDYDSSLAVEWQEEDTGIFGHAAGATGTHYMRLTARPGSVGDTSVSGDTKSLTAHGEDTRDIRALFRCLTPYSAFSVVQSASLSIDTGEVSTSGPPYGGEWENVSGCAVSQDGAEVKLVVSGAPGAARKRLDLSSLISRNRSLDGYRYLSFKIRSDADGRALRFAVNSVTPRINNEKTWSHDYLTTDPLVANIAVRTVTLDLCGPTNLTDDFDIDDSGVTANLYGAGHQDGPYFGVGELRDFGLQNLDAATYWISEVTLTRQNGSKLSIIPAFDHLNLESKSGDAVNYWQRLALGVTDGRQSLELPAAGYVDEVVLDDPPLLLEGGVLLAPNAYELTQNMLVLIVNTPADYPMHDVFAGWSATAIAGVTDPAQGGLLSDWLNLNRSAVWLRGGGLMWQGAAWIGSDEVDASSALTLYAQVMVDYIDFYPYAGDCFQANSVSPGYGDTTILTPGYMCRGGFHGLVLDDDHLPIYPQAVTITDQAGIGTDDAGSTTTDVRGWFKSGTPFAKGLHTIRVAGPGSGNYYDFSSPPAKNRKRHRLVLGRSANHDYRCIEADSPRGWLHVGYGARVRTFHISDFTEAFTGADYDVDTVERLRVDPRHGLLMVLGKSGTSAPFDWKLYRSDDGGLTGTEVLAVTANSVSVDIDSERGTQVVLYGDSSDLVFRQESQDGGETWAAAEQVMYAGAQLTATLVDMTHDPRWGHLLLLCEIAGSKTVLKSETLGVDWDFSLS